jgi:hypothetical protein
MTDHGSFVALALEVSETPATPTRASFRPVIVQYPRAGS